MLSHYDAVIWYTGQDYLTREPGQFPGTGTSRLALNEVVAIRARPRPASALSAVLTLAWRAMLKIKHVPFQLFDVTAFHDGVAVT